EPEAAGQSKQPEQLEQQNARHQKDHRYVTDPVGHTQRHQQHTDDHTQHKQQEPEERLAAPRQEPAAHHEPDQPGVERRRDAPEIGPGRRGGGGIHQTSCSRTRAASARNIDSRSAWPWEATTWSGGPSAMIVPWRRKITRVVSSATSRMSWLVSSSVAL